MTETPKTITYPKTLAEWRIKTLRSLGGQEWNLELTEQDLDHAIYQTLTLFSKYRPVFKWIPLGSHFGTAVIEMKDKIPAGVKVSEVKFQKDIARAHRPFRFPILDQQYGITGPRKIYNTLVAHDRYNSFIGTQPNWKFDPETMKLYIETPTTAVQATALVLLPFDIDNIPYDQEYDFLKTCVAHSKIILGRRMSKFGPIPSAQGQITLDGDTLRSEGENTIKEMEQQLDRNARRVIPRPIF